MKNTEPQKAETALHKNIVRVYAHDLCVFIFQTILKNKSV